MALYLQDQIVFQEEALKDADKKAVQDCRNSGSFRTDKQAERVEIMNNLLHLTERYRKRPITLTLLWLRYLLLTRADKYLLNLMELKSRPKATSFQMHNVRRWLDNANHPIRQEEVAYLDEEDDLVQMTSTPKNPLIQLVDKFPVLNFLRHVPCFRERKVRPQFYSTVLSRIS